MHNREEVIKGLEICTSRPCYCTDCPYKKECCLDSQNLMEDALALLLKEQEPRVLTWEETRKAEVCWLEPRGYEPFATLGADTWNSEKYGKSYRCWNRMPTDEQRKAVTWDG